MQHRSYLLYNPVLQQTRKHTASVNCMKMFSSKTTFQDKWEKKIISRTVFFLFISIISGQVEALHE